MTFSFVHYCNKAWAEQQIPFLPFIPNGQKNFIHLEGELYFPTYTLFAAMLKVNINSYLPGMLDVDRL